MDKPFSNSPIALSIVIPTYNEIARLPRTLNEVVPFLNEHFALFEILIVDDNSPDGTGAYGVQMSAQDSRIKVLSQPKRLGKGAAVRRGCLAAGGAHVLFMDADHATPIQEVVRFLQIVSDQTVDAVVGVRTYQEAENKWRRILGMITQILSHLLVFEKAVFDSQCGFKLFTRSAAQKIFPLCRVNGGMIDVEIFYIIHRLNLSCIYQPVHWINKAGTRINIIKCIFLDTIELFKIRLRRMTNIYARPLTEYSQPWQSGDKHRAL